MVVRVVKKIVPPLESGDRLTSEEFERRYEAMPKGIKAELIKGVVYVASPVRLDQHADPQINLISWIGHYKAYTPGIRAGDNATVRLDKKNQPQPDACMLIEPSQGGQCRIDDDGYIRGAPEWVGEITASTTSFDLHDKLDVYREFGVREYVVWRVNDEEIDWFQLRRNSSRRIIADEQGVLKSRVFPGLWLDVKAMLRGDLAAVFKLLDKGLASPEHAAFVNKLAS